VSKGLSLLALLVIHHHSVALSIASSSFLIGLVLVALHHTPSSSSLIAPPHISAFHQPISHRAPLDPISVLKPSFMPSFRAYPRFRALSRSLAIRIFAFPPFFRPIFTIFFISPHPVNAFPSPWARSDRVFPLFPSIRSDSRYTHACPHHPHFSHFPRVFTFFFISHSVLHQS
jgi:hypothetical protein